MRGVSSLFIRWICSLALIVAAMPARAGEAPCATTAPVPVAASESDCGMPCCGDKPQTEVMACGKHATKTFARRAEKTDLRAHRHGSHRLAKAVDPCKCEIKAAPRAPVAEVKAVVSGFDVHLLAATPLAALPELPSPIEIAAPGIFGADSGPPANAPHLSDFGRAPPAARA